MRVGRLGFRREAGRVLDMHGHRIDAVELARGVSGRQDRGGDSLAAAKIAPGEAVPRAGGRTPPSSATKSSQAGASIGLKPRI
jgi:hypothetical protein